MFVSDVSVCVCVCVCVCVDQSAGINGVRGEPLHMARRPGCHGSLHISADGFAEAPA